jgi:hypothetical protein
MGREGGWGDGKEGEDFGRKGGGGEEDRSIEREEE